MSRRRRVLVVDDDQSIREFINLTLTEEGYDVVTAADGAEALRRIAEDAPPDVILLDLKMPVMDGPAFADAYARVPGPRAPIIVLSAASDVGTFASKFDARAFLAKPFDLDLLIELVALHSSGPPDADATDARTGEPAGGASDEPEHR